MNHGGIEDTEAMQAKHRGLMRSATVEEVCRESGDWVFVDIGFAQSSRKSCGLALNADEPIDMCFSDLVAAVGRIAVSHEDPVNLLIEAPLSVAFDSRNNPKGRTIEKRMAATRYWYVGLGCSVLLATTYLIRSLYEAELSREIRLVEGFASFKQHGKKSSHTDDVRRLREVAWSKFTPSGRIVMPEELASHPGDRLQSAFAVAGMDLGVPPVVLLDL